MKMLFALALPALLAAAPLLAQETFETVPTSPEDQVRIFQELAALTKASCYLTDDEGNIIFVSFNTTRTESPGEGREWDGEVIQEKDKDELPGISDEDFHKIRHFPKLEGISLQFQPVTDRGYAVLQAFPEMKAISLANIKTILPDERRGEASSQIFRYLDGMRNLLVWDTTHSFGFQDEPPVLNELQGYPELKACIVDVGHADDFDELFPFLQKSPKIEFLKLHRCPFSDEQMTQIFDALPNLKRLDMKPRGNTPGKNWSYQSLRLLKDYPNIESLRLIHGDALPLPWEDGLEHLVEATNLKFLEFPLEGSGPVKAEDIARLMEARPDLKIVNLPEELLPEGEDKRDRRNRLRAEMEVNPMPYNYDIGPR